MGPSNSSYLSKTVTFQKQPFSTAMIMGERVTYPFSQGIFENEFPFPFGGIRIHFLEGIYRNGAF